MIEEMAKEANEEMQYVAGEMQKDEYFRSRKIPLLIGGATCSGDATGGGSCAPPTTDWLYVNTSFFGVVHLTSNTRTCGGSSTSSGSDNNCTCTNRRHGRNDTWGKSRGQSRIG